MQWRTLTFAIFRYILATSYMHNGKKMIALRSLSEHCRLKSEEGADD